MERILEGSGLIQVGGFKKTGGALITFAGALTSYTGIGLGGMAAGTVTGVSGISDIEQGINEIKLGLRNDSTTRTGNYVRDTLYDGNDTIYHLSTGTAAMAGMALRPYVMPKKNPVLAGGKQKDIAKKAAMGADDAAGGAEGGFKPGTLSNVDARRWYLEQEAKIPDLIDDSLPIEQQARQAFDLRNQYRTQARELMLDQQLAESLFRTDPNLTWDQIIQKQVAKGLSGDDIYREILESSQRSRTSVSQSLGLE